MLGLIEKLLIKHVGLPHGINQNNGLNQEVWIESILLGLNGAFVVCSIKLDLQSAGSSPNLTYTELSAHDAIRIL